MIDTSNRRHSLFDQTYIASFDVIAMRGDTFTVKHGDGISIDVVLGDGDNIYGVVSDAVVTLYDIIDTLEMSGDW